MLYTAFVGATAKGPQKATVVKPRSEQVAAALMHVGKGRSRRGTEAEDRSAQTEAAWP